MKFSGNVYIFSMIRYAKFCDDRPIRSRAILGKPYGGCINPPPSVPARVKVLLYVIQIALTRETKWCQLEVCILFRSKVMIKFALSWHLATVFGAGLGWRQGRLSVRQWGRPVLQSLSALGLNASSSTNRAMHDFVTKLALLSRMLGSV